jgi:hypothetical protein
MLSQKSLSHINLAIIKQNRRGDCCIDYIGRRFLIDTNIKTVSWEICTANGVTLGTAIRKMNGKYAIGNYEYQFTESGLQVHTKIHFTANYKQVKKLIDEHIEYSERYRILDAHDEQVTWSVFAPHLDKPDWGDLPEGFTKVTEELEAVPEFIDID